MTGNSVFADRDFVFDVARDLDINRDLAVRVADYIVGQVECAGYGEKINALRELLDEHPNRKSITCSTLRQILGT